MRTRWNPRRSQCGAIHTAPARGGATHRPSTSTRPGRGGRATTVVVHDAVSRLTAMIDAEMIRFMACSLLRRSDEEARQLVDDRRAKKNAPARTGAFVNIGQNETSISA